MKYNEDLDKIESESQKHIIRLTQNNIQIENEKDIEASLEKVESPVLVNQKIIWPNNEYIWTHLSNGKRRTITSKILLESCFSVSIRILQLKCPNHITIGVSEREIDEEKAYLGSSFGNWAIAATGTVYEEGKCKSNNLSYKEGDILTIKGENGLITYRVNDIDSKYQYDLKTPKLFLGVSLYYINDKLEILI